MHRRRACRSRCAQGVPVVATNDVRFLGARRFRVARGARLHPRRHAARRSRRAAHATASSSTCARPRRWRSSSPTFPKRSRTRSRSRGAAAWSCSSARRALPDYPVPCGQTTEDFLRAESRAGSTARLAAPAARSPAERRNRRGITTRARDRARRHLPDGLRRLLPDRRGLHPLGARATASRWGRAAAPAPARWWPTARHHRPRSAALRPAVRALPESRARVDAGLRHRLLHGRPRPRHRVRRARATAASASRRSSPTARWRRRPWCATSAACSA